MRNKNPRKIRVTSEKNNGKSFTKIFQHWEKNKANAYRARQQAYVDSGELYAVTGGNK